ncbi:MAG: hypothetical protein ACI9J3_000791 [Parvicellaceae bacterium]|jgi:hypothetical protein
MLFIRSCFLIIIVFLSCTNSISQNLNSGGSNFSLQLNTITTSVPFLMIAPDANHSGLGDAGIATVASPHSLHWNQAQLASISDSGMFNQECKQKNFGVSLNYSGWLRRLVPGINLFDFSGYKVTGRRSATSASLKFFSLGEVAFFNPTGSVNRTYRPKEFAAQLGYTRKITKSFSMGISGKFIYSDFAGNLLSGVVAGKSFAAGLSMLYKSRQFKLLTKQFQISAGAQISNVGNKMFYTSNSFGDFLPQNLKVGVGISVELSDQVILVLVTDANKLLVPTGPLYLRDASGNTLVDPYGNYMIAAGMDPNASVFEGIKQSFHDAPGAYYDDGGALQEIGVAAEEFREINWSFASELRIAEMVFLRSGFFYEHYTKGNRQYATVGIGGKYKMYEANVSLLLPTSQQHPLARTVRVGIAMTL